ncbi:hypothetical protein [Gottfriedia solisilvae]|uniref:hypothetical protein n=1 Tax=Gottfriedia solisilvae TaxID=1516104 RepID=UPI003D2ED2C5
MSFSNVYNFLVEYNNEKDFIADVLVTNNNNNVIHHEKDLEIHIREYHNYFNVNIYWEADFNSLGLRGYYSTSYSKIFSTDNSMTIYSVSDGHIIKIYKK